MAENGKNRLAILTIFCFRRTGVKKTKAARSATFVFLGFKSLVKFLQNSIYTYRHFSQKPKPKRELQRKALQLSFGFWLGLKFFCHKGYIARIKLSLAITQSAMISSNDFRPGVTIELDGEVWRVVEFLHVKPGKGSAFVRTTLKSAMTGKNLERTFRAGEMVPQAVLEKSSMQHTYKDGEDYVFMDMQSYEEANLTSAQIGSRVKYIKEGMEVNVVRWGDRVIDVELPNTVVLEVIETDPGLKGDTATGGSKAAKVETGASINVPLFVNIGDRIKIDTREDTYLGREN